MGKLYNWNKILLPKSEQANPNKNDYTHTPPSPPPVHMRSHTHYRDIGKLKSSYMFLPDGSENCILALFWQLQRPEVHFVVQRHFVHPWRPVAFRKAVLTERSIVGTCSTVNFSFMPWSSAAVTFEDRVPCLQLNVLSPSCSCRTTTPRFWGSDGPLPTFATLANSQWLAPMTKNLAWYERFWCSQRCEEQIHLYLHSNLDKVITFIPALNSVLTIRYYLLMQWMIYINF